MSSILPFSHSKVERVLFWTAVLTTLACLATQIIGLTLGRWNLYGLTDFFGLDVERSFPTWFTSMLWALVSAMSWCVVLKVRQKDFFVLHWKLLTGLFLLISIDEITAVHEKIGWRVGELVHAKGYLFFPFVIPGIILAIIVAVSYSAFLWKHPRYVSIGMVASGFLYLLGVIVLEAVAANWTYEHGGMTSDKRGLLYFILSDTEEFLEMMAALLMFRTLTTYRDSI